MSRTLSKVLVVCAMIVVLPLMIVGTAFATYFSIDNVVNVATVFINDEKAASDDVYARISYDGKVANSFNVSKGHTKTLKVTADYSQNAYNFLGWYKGSQSDFRSDANPTYLTENVDGNTLSVPMSEAESFVAVYEAVKFNVAWNYKETPNADVNSTKMPVGGKDAYVYGEELPTLEYNGYDYNFNGWRVEGDVSTTYTHATFEDDVTLNAVWQEANKVVITFHSQKEEGKTYEHEIYKGQPLDLSEVTSQALEGLNIEATAGYEYKWTDVNGAVVSGSVSTDSNSDFYLKTTAVEYTLTLSFKSDDLKSAPDAEVTFTVEDTTALDQWFNLSPKYSFWNVEGVKYGETTYKNVSDFAKAYAEDSSKGNPTLQITKNLATWVCQPKITVKGADEKQVFMPTLEDYNLDVYKGNDTKPFNFGENTTENSTATIYEWLNVSTNSNNQLYVYRGNAVSEANKVAVKISALYFEFGGTSITLQGVDESTTLNDAIALLVERTGMEVANNTQTFTLLSTWNIVAVCEPAN